MTEQCYILILSEHNPTWTSQNQKEKNRTRILQKDGGQVERI